jgi:predicted ATPase
VGTLFRGWARSVSGDAAEGICLIEEGLKNLWATGTMVTTPLLLALKAEALHLANHTTEALKAIREAETSAEKRQERWWCAEPHRLRGVFIAAIGARRCKSKLRFATLSELHKSRSRLPLW